MDDRVGPLTQDQGQAAFALVFDRPNLGTLRQRAFADDDIVVL